MVNLNRRLAVLNPLLDIRTGPGAIRLPNSPHPHLFRLELKYPKSRKIKPSKVTSGAHGFHKSILPGLKYYNPALDVDVQTYPKSPTLLTLHFQCKHPDKLRELAQPSRKIASVDNSADPSYEDPEAPRPSAANDEVTLKPVSADSHLPQPLYQRSVTLALRGRATWDIVRWFNDRTNGQRIGVSAEDKKKRKEIKARQAAADADRELSKINQAALDREKSILEQAKKLAEVNAAEAS
ncbi:uncharacterized protein HMPREF1541_11105 [Cyphellophora europaea CBS 101466]|uniref:Ribosomal protein/NADH dehydrogenase domain-containing protein n=1 Tax=Cyphellophora europaea (strain CBS 101466) TaxID=1220924 RepID=W2S514_CYPE1|nr:uncharacterized protein HMPREF1541_11105 [Cyphellophora europaea CBS 101466]ETN43781.1 hypothetical protein HMPREF1541_11105 [Cyphellophora europaea CBS 101466]